MSETVALSESTEWPDLKVDQKAIDRRRKDTLEALERLDLKRQVKLMLAAELYKRFDPMAWVRKKFGSEYKRSSCRITSQNGELSLRVNTEIQAYMRPIECLNRLIPYSILLALEEAKESKVFDNFLIAAPWQDFQLTKPVVKDPVLVGVIESPMNSPIHAVYFFIAEWE